MAKKTQLKNPPPPPPRAGPPFPNVFQSNVEISQLKLQMKIYLEVIVEVVQSVQLLLIIDNMKLVLYVS